MEFDADARVIWGIVWYLSNGATCLRHRPVMDEDEKELTTKWILPEQMELPRWFHPLDELSRWSSWPMKELQMLYIDY